MSEMGWKAGRRKMAEPELKTCPFCGGQAIAEEMMIQWRVTCKNNCTGYHWKEKQAIEAWNKRV